MELYINGANPKTNTESKSGLEKDIEVAKGSKHKEKQLSSLGNLRQILPVSMLFNSSTVLASGTQIYCHKYGLYGSYHRSEKFKVLLLAVSLLACISLDTVFPHNKRTFL